MRILIHDYSGHAFQADLARRLAARGHEVLHASCASFPAPKGRLELGDGAPSGLAFTTLSFAGKFHKYRFVHRWRLEQDYGRRLAGLIRDWRPEALLIATTPLDPMAAAFSCCEELGIPKLFWLQDLYSAAIQRYLGHRWAGLGGLVALRYRALEADIARRADAVIAITEGFLPVLQDWAVPPARISVQPNWAPLADIPVMPKSNPWAEAHGLGDRPVALYSGTLGLKHDPALLVALAAAFPGDDGLQVVVASEGEGARWLQRQAGGRGLANLHVLPFQPVEQVPAMLASADLLLSLLEPGAGVFSVPSKILAQLCAGRALLAAIPAENDAARMIEEAQAGRVVAPGDQPGWLAAARELLDDSPLRERLGANARRFAEGHFDSERIAARFEGLLEACLRREDRAVG